MSEHGATCEGQPASAALLSCTIFSCAPPHEEEEEQDDSSQSEGASEAQGSRHAVRLALLNVCCRGCPAGNEYPLSVVVAAKQLSHAEAVHEWSVLRQLQGCPFIPRTFTPFSNSFVTNTPATCSSCDEAWWLATEWAACGTCEDLIVLLREQRGNEIRPLLSEAAVKLLTACLLLALHQAHCQGIAHMDVKSANCLLLPSGRLLLSDWGCSVVQERRQPTQGLLDLITHPTTQQHRRQQAGSSDSPGSACAQASPDVSPCSAPDHVAPMIIHEPRGTPAYAAPEVMRLLYHRVHHHQSCWAQLFRRHSSSASSGLATGWVAKLHKLVQGIVQALRPRCAECECTPHVADAGQPDSTPRHTWFGEASHEGDITAPGCLASLVRHAGQGYDALSADLYSVGATILELLTGYPHTAAVTAGGLLWVQLPLSLELPDGTSPELRDLLSRLLAEQPGRRGTAAQALQHAWFADLELYKLYVSSLSAMSQHAWGMSALVTPESHVTSHVKKDRQLSLEESIGLPGAASCASGGCLVAKAYSHKVRVPPDLRRALVQLRDHQLAKLPAELKALQQAR